MPRSPLYGEASAKSPLFNAFLQGMGADGASRLEAQDMLADYCDLK